MSMEDILKVLVNSRQPGNASQQGSDPMAGLIGSLLGGQPQNTSGSHAPINPNAGYNNAGSADLSGMMGLLEMFMGGQQGSSTTSTSNSPIMALISPFVPALAKKAKISPELAMIIISFVVHKLLAHHPTSQRDSNTFDFDDMLGQMSTGKVDSNLLRQSGMVNELSNKTGLNEAQTEQALQLAFATVGKTVSKFANRGGSSAKPTGTRAKSAGGGRSLGTSGAKASKKITR